MCGVYGGCVVYHSKEQSDIESCGRVGGQVDKVVGREKREKEREEREREGKSE